MLHSLEGLFAVNADVDRAVPNAELASFAVNVGKLAGGAPPFAVDPVTAGEQHYVIEFNEPMEGNENAFGLDPGRPAVASRSDSGDIVSTNRTPLVQDITRSPAIVARALVYRHNMLAYPVMLLGMIGAGLFWGRCHYPRDHCIAFHRRHRGSNACIQTGCHGPCRAVLGGLVPGSASRHRWHWSFIVGCVACLSPRCAFNTDSACRWKRWETIAIRSICSMVSSIFATCPPIWHWVQPKSAPRLRRCASQPLAQPIPNKRRGLRLIRKILRRAPRAA